MIAPALDPSQSAEKLDSVTYSVHQTQVEKRYVLVVVVNIPVELQGRE
jgi:hypothetical protein